MRRYFSTRFFLFLNFVGNAAEPPDERAVLPLAYTLKPNLAYAHGISASVSSLTRTSPPSNSL